MERFSVRDVVEIPQRGLRALKLHHRPTNLTHLHVERKGAADRVFSLAFNAPVQSGLAYIVQLASTSGSARYPVGDVLANMRPRSLAHDKTVIYEPLARTMQYSFATTNKTDFANLQQLYMDIAFKPLLRKQDFLRQGWRLEPADLTDTKSPLVFKGIVYEAQKMMMSVPRNQHYMSLLAALYPSRDSPGSALSNDQPVYDALRVPELTYEDMLQLHRNYCHPSNCFTFSYGDFSVEEAVTPISEYLNEATPMSTPRMPRCEPIELKQPEYALRLGQLDPQMLLQSSTVKFFFSSLTWYVGPTSDLSLALLWKVIELLLMRGQNTPLHKALIDSEVGPEFSLNTGLAVMPGKLMFTIGLQQVEPFDQTFKTTTLDAIDESIASGFSREQIDAVLHEIEFHDREVGNNYGLDMLEKVTARAFHPSGDVMDVLSTEKDLNVLKAKLAENPRLLQDAIAAAVGRNRPYFEYVQGPNFDYDEEQAIAEQELLAEKLATMSDDAKAEAISEARELAHEAEQPQNVEVLPKLALSDVAPEAREYPVQRSKVNRIELVTRETTTNGISYIRIVRDISSLPKQLVPYLPMYADSLTKVGTAKRSAAELETLIKLNMGSVRVQALVQPWGSLELVYEASALDSKLLQMYELLTELATSPQFNNLSELTAVLQSSAADFWNTLEQSGHEYAVKKAGTALNEQRAAEDLLSGVSASNIADDLASDDAALRTDLVPKLLDIHAIPWSVRAIGLAHSHNAEVHARHEALVAKFIEDVGATQAPTAPDVATLYSPDKPFAGKWDIRARKISIVGTPPPHPWHVGAALRGCELGYSHEDSVALEVLAVLLTRRYLLPQIQNHGAQGAGADYNAVDALFSMFSSHDPSPTQSLRAMRRAGTWAAEHAFTEVDVEEAKFALIAALDAPISPREELDAHLGLQLGDARQRRRTNLLAVKPADLNRVAEKYLKPALASDDLHALCFIGPASPEGRELIMNELS